MAYFEQVYAEPDFRGVTSRDRRGGFYRRYHPDTMIRGIEVLERDAIEHAYDVAARVAVLGERLRSRPLSLLYASLLRSESIASSWVEGERETPRNVMLARLDHDRATQTGRHVSQNIDAMSAAIERLGGVWTHRGVQHIHHTLLPGMSGSGYRGESVYIGGSSPLSAQFVPPPHEEVAAFMDDLLTYVNTGGDSPLVAALLVHAQFETVHPFPDGNGRVGRALFHGLLHRAGAVTGGVLPLSLALKEDRSAYVEALTAYRYEGNGNARRAATSSYVEQMLDFVIRSADLAEDFMQRVDEIWHQWEQVLSAYRSDSSVHRAIEVLIQQPVVTTAYLQMRLQVTKMAAHTTVNNLVEVGILSPSGGKLKRSNLFQADAVLRLLESGAAGR